MAARRVGAMKIASVVRRLLPVAVIFCVGAGSAVAGSGFTIFDAIKEAVRSNPGVGEAAADRHQLLRDVQPGERHAGGR